MKSLVVSVLASWFGLVCLLGARGVFVRPETSPPYPILIGVVAPLGAFFLALATWKAFRVWIATADVELLSALHAWRTGGLGFLALAANGVLPDSFAQPAGWGDIAIGVTAPWIALTVARRPGRVNSRLLAAWNIFGILDLLVAVGMGVLSSGFLPKVHDGVTTSAMTRLPLVVIPAFFVPLYVMLHASALATIRRQRALACHNCGTCP